MKIKKGSLVRCAFGHTFYRVKEVREPFKGWDGGVRPEAYLVTTSAKDTGSYRNGDEIVLVAS